MAAQDVEFEAIADADGRFGRLAELLGLADADHARGKVEHLWMACTTRGETDLPQWLVERHLGERGPAALVEAELARWSRGRGDTKTRRMYICGSKKRCLWMRNNQEQAPKGGKARAEKASRVAGKFAPDGLAPEPAPSPSSPLPSPSSPLPDPPIPPKGGSPSRSGSKPSDPTAAERDAFRRVMDRLSKETGIAYRGSAAHLRLVVARLREGVHELELRAVIAFCASKWEGKPDMADYLRPETLFGPTTIHRYLDAARTKYADDIAREIAKGSAQGKRPGDDEPPPPKLELVS